MSTAMQRLQFVIDAVNNTTRPMAQVMRSIDQLQQRSQAAMGNIRNGMMTGFGAGYAFKSYLEPIRDFENALGEVSSLDVEPEALKKLQSQALKYSMQYGGSASDFVRASYDIQSAISGLNGTELAQFTNSSAILAKATKSDTGTITNYMGTMYGIFKNQAAKMGNAAWVEQLTGKTAAAVQMFKTTGSGMAQAFTSLGAEATSAGVGLSEQIAILGTLQSTMGGGEAGTKYRAFLAGVGKAQDKLGLTFTDSNNRLLPMANILTELKKKFGPVIDQAESDALATAFGSTEATGLIKLLMADVDGLSGSIHKLRKINSAALAAKMANKQLDPWERMGAVLKALSITFTQSIMPVVNWFADKMAGLGQTVLRWSKMFPHLTKAVGIAIMGIFGLVMAFSVLSIIVGTVKLAMLSFGAVFAIITSPITLIVIGISALVAGLVLLWKNWDWVTATVKDFGQTIVGWVLPVWEKLKSAFSNSLIGKSVALIFDTIKFAIKGFIKLVNKIPGVNIDLGFDELKTPKLPENPVPKPIQQSIQTVSESQRLIAPANQAPPIRLPIPLTNNIVAMPSLGKAQSFPSLPTPPPLQQSIEQVTKATKPVAPLPLQQDIQQMAQPTKVLPFPSLPTPPPLQQSIEQVTKATKPVAPLPLQQPENPMQRTNTALQEQKALVEQMQPIKPVDVDMKAVVAEIQAKVQLKTGRQQGGNQLHIGSIHTSESVNLQSFQQMMDATA